MRILLLLIVGIACFLACKNDSVKTSNTEAKSNFSVIEEGIFVEKFAPSVTDDNRFNYDNKIYKVGRTFVYNYVYSDPEGKQLHFEGGRDGWNFVPVGTDRYYVVKSIEITVMSGLKPMIEQIPEYNQTLLKFICPPNTDYTISGVVENYRNVWMHPPREALFKILELNPFPFIQEPYEVGHSWDWELNISSEWGDPRWMTWEGVITNKYVYKITDKVTVMSALGELDCFIIEAEAKSGLGNSQMKALFNDEYGFIEMDFTNIDGSKLKMELAELREADKQE